MTPVELSRTVLRAVRCAVAAGELSVAVPERAVVERPGPGGCGDYATGIALRLAAGAGRPAGEVARLLRPRLLEAPGVARVDITGPGFLNITLGREAGTAGDIVREVLRAGQRYGYAPSAGPVIRDGLRAAAGGPAAGGGSEGGAVLLVHPAEVRAAVVADALARLLWSQGAGAVRVRCPDGEVPEAWVRGLGLGFARFGAGGPPAGADDVVRRVRPVPAGSDPLPLGRDAGRWALLLPAASRRALGSECLIRRDENPLFRVQYAHFRARALVREAARLGFGPRADAAATATGPTPATTAIRGVHSLAHTPAARETPATVSDVTGGAAARLLGLLRDHPSELRTAARLWAPDRAARGLVRVADAFFDFHDALPALPSGDEKPSAAHRARLAVVEATGTVLAGGLTLLGIDAPDLI